MTAARLSHLPLSCVCSLNTHPFHSTVLAPIGYQQSCKQARLNTLRAQATRLTRAGFELALVQCQPKLTPVELSTVLWEQAAETDYLPPEGRRVFCKVSSLPKKTV